MSTQYTTLIIDLHAFFTPVGEDIQLVNDNLSLSIKRLRSSFDWLEYERGKISESTCYENVGREHGFPATVIASTVGKYRASLSYTSSIFSAIEEYCQAPETNLQVIGVSNIDAEEYQYLRARWPQHPWSIFNRMYLSSSIKMRVPNPKFFRHVIEVTGLSPEDSLFIDTNIENVIVARSLGIASILAKNGQDLIRVFKNIFGNPVERGNAYLRANAGHMLTTTEDNIEIRDNYAQFMILEHTGDPNLIYVKAPRKKWNFFDGDAVFTTKAYPNDLDTTSIAYLSMPPNEKIIHEILDEMLQFCNDEGIIMTLFDHSRPRVDPVICANILTLFYCYNRGHQLPHTLKWLRDILVNRAYINGTLYYGSAEWFLFYINRLLLRANNDRLTKDLGPLLKERILERVGAPADAPSLAMRISVCSSMALNNARDLETLLSLQYEDGGWEPGRMYCFPKLNIWVGNRGVTTALSIAAIKSMAQVEGSSAMGVASNGGTGNKKILDTSRSHVATSGAKICWTWASGMIQVLKVKATDVIQHIRSNI